MPPGGINHIWKAAIFPDSGVPPGVCARAMTAGGGNKSDEFKGRDWIREWTVLVLVLVPEPGCQESFYFLLSLLKEQPCLYMSHVRHWNARPDSHPFWRTALELDLQVLMVNMGCICPPISVHLLYITRVSTLRGLQECWRPSKVDTTALLRPIKGKLQLKKRIQ